MKRARQFLAGLLGAAIFALHPQARAEEPAGQAAGPRDGVQDGKLPVRVTECRAPECLIVNLQDLRRVFEAYDSHVAELEKQLADLKRSKGCAKLEVTEPPRNFVPKKERES